MNRYLFFLTVLLALGAFSPISFASHITDGEITYTHVSGNQYMLQVVRYRLCGAVGAPTNYSVDAVSSCMTATFSLPTFSTEDISPYCAAFADTTDCVLSGPTALRGYEKVTYRSAILLPAACQDWKFRAKDCCRYTSSNLSLSPMPFATLETQLNNVLVPNNSSPTFDNIGISYIMGGQPYIYDSRAIDPDGDELRFRLVDSDGDFGVPANYLPGLSGTNPFPFSAQLDSLTGNLSFTATNSTSGFFLVCFLVEEYRNGVLIATTRREVTFIIFPPSSTTNNTFPQANLTNISGATLSNGILYTQANQQLSFDIVVTDADGDSLLLYDYGLIQGFSGSSSSSAQGLSSISSTFSWTPPANGRYQGSFVYKEFNCPIALGHFEHPIIIQAGTPPTFNPRNYFIGTDSSLLLCGDFWSQLGSIASSTILQGPTHGNISHLTTDSSCFNYQAPSVGNILDSVWLELCDSTGLCDTSLFIIEVVTCVWAGDTDTNLVVNNWDLLAIGLAYGEAGSTRPNADLLFDCEPSHNWSRQTPISMVNYKHLDCNGNGSINAVDTQAIVQNWQPNTNTITTNTQGPPLYLDYTQAYQGSTIQIPIMLGENTNPVFNAYGIAFTINYDTSMVTSNSVAVQLSNSWLGFLTPYQTSVPNMIGISKVFDQAGEVQIGLTRINQQTVGGLGQIGTLQLKLANNIITSNNPTPQLNLSISNVRFITNQEVAIPLSTPPNMIAILDSGTIVSTPSPSISQPPIEVFPNPSNQQLWLKSQAIISGQLELSTTTGQLLRQADINSKEFSISTGNLPNGLYILQIRTSKGLQSKRILIQH